MFMSVVPLLLFGHVLSIRQLEAAAPVLPLVYSPGTGNTVLHVTVKNQQSYHDCPQNAEYRVTGSYVEGDIDPTCAYKLLKLIPTYNKEDATWKFENLPGVTTSIPDWGRPECFYDNRAVEGLAFGPYMLMGYKPGDNFVVNCLDWRLSPTVAVGQSTGAARRTFQDNLVVTVEDLFRKHKRKVLLYGFSSGALNTLYVLTRQPKEWISQYVAGFISVAGSLAGAEVALPGLLNGEVVQDVPLPGTRRLNVAPSNIAEAVRTWPAGYSLLPNVHVYGDLPLIKDQATGKIYTAKGYPELFRAAGYELAAQLASSYANLLNPLEVPVMRIHGMISNLPHANPATFLYKDLAHDKEYRIVNMTGGDRMISDISSSTLDDWQQAYRERGVGCPVKVTDMTKLGLSHTELPVAPLATGQMVHSVRTWCSNACSLFRGKIDLPGCHAGSALKEVPTSQQESCEALYRESCH